MSWIEISPQRGWWALLLPASRIPLKGTTMITLITLRNKLRAFWFVALPQWLAWKLPSKVCYFALIRVWAKATTGKYSSKTPDEITWSDALKAWEAN